MRAAKRPCTYPGCGRLTESRRCDKHAHVDQRELDARRGSSAERLYGARWRRERLSWLRLHPLCACDECDAGRKRVTVATVVDHVIPHRGNEALFWDRSNWRSMAKACHDRKTAREDGGFGRAPAQGVPATKP